MTTTFWLWAFGLYAAFVTGLFLVVAIGGHQIREGQRRTIAGLRSQHAKLEASAARAARLLFRQRRRIQKLTADLAETERHLSISHLVCDTLAYDLAEAIRPVTDWEPPVAPVATTVHDAAIVDLFTRELEKPMDEWSL